MNYCDFCGAPLSSDIVFCSSCGKQHRQSTTSTVTPSNVRTNELMGAEFGVRFAAAFIDGIIVTIPNIVILLLLQEFRREIGFTRSEAEIARLVLNLLVAVAYSTLPATPLQATLGKKLCGLKVVDASGGPITFPQALGRYFASLISALPLGIGYFMVLWDPRRRTLHDKLADTYVIRSR